MSTKKGFTLVEIMIVVAIIALLTAIAIPAFLQYRADARRGLCMNNLRLIDHAKEVLAIKMNWTSGYTFASDAIWASNLDPYIDGTQNLSCPDNTGVDYDYNPVDTTPECKLGPAPGGNATLPEHIYVPAGG